MSSMYDKAWSPYVAGVLIGLLQIPAFLMIETALGASSSGPVREVVGIRLGAFSG